MPQAKNTPERAVNFKRKNDRTNMRSVIKKHLPSIIKEKKWPEVGVKIKWSSYDVEVLTHAYLKVTCINNTLVMFYEVFTGNSYTYCSNNSTKIFKTISKIKPNSDIQEATKDLYIDFEKYLDT